MVSETKANFFQRPFDDATMLKLEIFRHYIREWLPVFLTRRTSGSFLPTSVNMYDFFAGPGRDAAGNPGSPLIIVYELKQYCANQGDRKSETPVRVLFNDKDRNAISELKKTVQESRCEKSCCHIEFTSQPFAESLSSTLPAMRAKASAHLVIMDQFGIKEVTPAIIQTLARCQSTDLLFFISTSYIRRFIETPEIGKHFNLAKGELKDTEFNVIHRHLCDYFRSALGGETFYLAPFSIKKGSNIYGVIFGSRHLFGLEKFLKVCWALDPKTGEANYNIDQEQIWTGQLSFNEEENTFKKIDLFKQELKKFVSEKKPNNIGLNEFCLLNGFSPSKAGEVLTELQSKGELIVWDLMNKKQARKRAFYLGWDNCKNKVGKVRFSWEK